MRAALAVAAALVAVLAQTAGATTPGRNGVIAFVGSTKAKTGTVDAVYSIGLDGKGFRRISSQVRIMYGESWSPAGGRIAVAGRGLLWTMRPDGSDVRRVRLGDSSLDVDSPSWSPDGKRIAFTYVGNRRTSDNEGIGIYAVAPGGGTAKKLVDLSDLVVSDPAGVDWSPDGKRLVFGGYVVGEEQYVIFVKPLSGKARVLTHPPEGALDFFPAWSPDGRTIAFARVPDPDEDASEIVLIGADGKNERELTLAPGVDPGTPAWSPDGRYLAYNEDKGARIHVLDVKAGTEQVVRVPQVRNVTQIAWQPLRR